MHFFYTIFVLKVMLADIMTRFTDRDNLPQVQKLQSRY